MSGAAYYIVLQVAKWLSLVPECKINTSTEKVNSKIRDLTVKSDELVVSFDVSSLYTNVPVKDAIIDVCTELLLKYLCIDNLDNGKFKILAEIAYCGTIFANQD